MAWTTPVVIAPNPPVGFAPCQGQVGSPGFGVENNPVQPPIRFNGKIYIALSNVDRNGNAPQAAGIWRSADNGATWTGPLDSAHAPGFNNAVPVFDGAHTLLVFYSTTIEQNGNPTLGVARVTPFNLATETWGANAGDTAATYMYVSQAFLRPNNTVLALLAFGYSFDLNAPAGWHAGVWQAGAWIAEFAIDTNGPQPAFQAVQQGPSGAMDSTGVVHVVMNFQTNNNLYQRINLDNTLGQFQLPCQAGGVLQNFCVFQNQLVIAAQDAGAHASFFTGAITGAPSFTRSAANPDPGGPDDVGGSHIMTASVSADGNTCYIVYTSPTTLAVRVCKSTDLVNWTAETAGTQTGTFGDICPGVVYDGLVPHGIGLVFGDSVPTLILRSNFTSEAVPVPQPPPTPPPQIAGAPQRVAACAKRNSMDWCLFAEQLAMMHVHFPPMCNIPEEYRCLLPWDDEHGAIPPQARTFQPSGSIITPTTASGDSLVLAMTMPRGYDGLLSGIFQIYSGTGFVQGSGDIRWRIQVNQRYVRDLSNNPFSLGTPKLPFPLTEGQILLAGQTIRYFVNVPNLSGNIQIGASRITVGFIGFYWPRG